MPVVQGFISVTDLVDGVVGNAVIFTNENHTYVADADGAVESGEIAMYSNDVFVEAGVVDITYNPGADLAPDANNQFTIATEVISGQTYRRATGLTLVPSNADIEVRITGANNDPDATITLFDRGTANTVGFFDAGGSNSATITIPVAVRTTAGTVTYNKVISVSKAVGGSAPYVRMTASDQTVEYPYLGSAPKTGQANITLNALAFNTPASVSGTDTGLWFYSTDNSTYTQLDSDDLTLAGENTDNSSITFTTAQYNTLLGTARRVIFRFARQADADDPSLHTIFDQISVFRVDDAETGYTSYVEVVAGTTAFKNGIAYDANNAATYADLAVRVFSGDTEVLVGNAADITYQWTKNGVDLEAGDVDLTQAQQNAILPINTYGVVRQFLRINASDVADNGADVFGCTVDFTFDG